MADFFPQVNQATLQDFVAISSKKIDCSRLIVFNNINMAAINHPRSSTRRMF